MPTAEARFLLDTHTFLWMTMAPERLGESARRLLDQAATSVLLSVASVWEIAIKTSLGKLELPGSPSGFLEEQLAATRTTVLPVTFQHAVRTADLPWYHRDPFDRLIVAQALYEKLPLLSGDSTLDGYEVERIW